jgi:hypothetical protein
VYVDGKVKGEAAIPGAIAQGAGEGATGGLHVGNSPAYGGPAAKFIIDDLAVYTRGLDEGEVAEIMKGDFLAVEATGKLAYTWGKIKADR